MPISVNDFAKYILESQSKGNRDIDQMYIDFVNARLLNYEESKLEDNYPEYKALLQEYKEGILLFDLMNKKVWTKAVEDTIGMQAFLPLIDLHIFGLRVDATIYVCANLETAKKVRRNIYKKNRGNITDEEILALVNTNSKSNLNIDRKRFVIGENKHIDYIDHKVGISKDIVLEDGSYILINIHALLPQDFKKLNETRGKVIADFQKLLEKEWLVDLKSKYSVKINKKALYSLIK